ncbi:MAG: hypothetical protein V3T84_15850 [Phycisphaerales bacterium]
MDPHAALSGSPCIDHADNTTVPKDITTDLDGAVGASDLLILLANRG